MTEVEGGDVVAVEAQNTSVQDKSLRADNALSTHSEAL